MKILEAWISKVDSVTDPSHEIEYVLLHKIVVDGERIKSDRSPFAPSRKDYSNACNVRATRENIHRVRQKCVPGSAIREI